MIGAVCVLGFGQREVLVDAGDLDAVAVHRWRLMTARVTSGGVYQYAVRKSAGRTHLLHRDLMNPAPSQVVDHLNGNRLDNRRANLRVCSHAENMQNRKINIDNTSGVKGVTWSRAHQAWVARCARKYLGTFRTIGEASQAYDAEARRRYAHLGAVT